MAFGVHAQFVVVQTRLAAQAVGRAARGAADAGDRRHTGDGRHAGDGRRPADARALAHSRLPAPRNTRPGPDQSGAYPRPSGAAAASAAERYRRRTRRRPAGSSAGHNTGPDSKCTGRRRRRSDRGACPLRRVSSSSRPECSSRCRNRTPRRTRPPGSSPAPAEEGVWNNSDNRPGEFRERAVRERRRQAPAATAQARGLRWLAFHVRPSPGRVTKIASSRCRVGGVSAITPNRWSKMRRWHDSGRNRNGRRLLRRYGGNGRPWVSSRQHGLSGRPGLPMQLTPRSPPSLRL